MYTSRTTITVASTAIQGKKPKDSSLVTDMVITLRYWEK